MTAAGPVARPPEETAHGRSLFGAAVMVISGVVCVIDVHGLVLKITVGVLMLAAELGLILIRRGPARRAGLLAVILVVAAGITVTVLVPNGLGEVPVLAGAAVLPRFLDAGWPRGTGIAVVSVAFGVSVMVVSGSPVGLLAGAGAWALADRSVEQAAYRAERDRALALLAEVQASREAQREAAAAEERNRIAHEMHDVLAHSLAGLSMQLQAIRAVAAAEGAPPSITGPVDRAAELARAGVQEARAAVGVLREPRQHGLDDLEALVSGFPGDVSLHVVRPRRSGHARGGPRRLPGGPGSHDQQRPLRHRKRGRGDGNVGPGAAVRPGARPRAARGARALRGQGRRYRDQQHGRPDRGGRAGRLTAGPLPTRSPAVPGGWSSCPFR